MKIQVRTEGRRFFLPVPLWGGLIRLGLAIGRKYSDKVPDADFVLPIVKELKRYKKQNGKFVLVEAESEDAYIKITI